MTELVIGGMTCDSCATHVRQALEKVPGVHAAQVSYPKGRARLTLAPDTSMTALVAAVTALGYRARVADGNADRPRDGLLDKARSWLGGGQKATGGDEALHVAVIGSGGAAMGAARKAAERGARVPLIEPLETDEKLRSVLIRDRPDYLSKLRLASLRQGIIPLRVAAASLAARGEIDIDTAITNTPWDNEHDGENSSSGTAFSTSLFRESRRLMLNGYQQQKLLSAMPEDEGDD